MPKKMNSVANILGGQVHQLVMGRSNFAIIAICTTIWRNGGQIELQI